ncbi:metallophosphoesterase [Psychrobacter frigidicola]|uniref:Metallophosphoesterase n=1 Tax=Psychrobacter frigidicola TaxID=45611 RepID=A0A5C7A7M9_9GAMM|nr:metallophosphoesterase [Psychrobacter frigidicola]TXD96750.1 metallophosphoesterase [Psychrobacter frigidicola]
MLKFIVTTQVLALSTSAALYWLLRIKRRRHIIVVVSAVVIINNIVLIYGLSAFRNDRFGVYLVINILQGFMIYAAIITLIVALTYYGLFRQPRVPHIIRAVAILSYIGIVGLAVFNTYSPVVHRLTVTTDKPLDKPLTMALVSDTHLDRWFGNRQLDKLASLVEAQNVDVVLLAGDIMNDSTYYYDKTNMREHLEKLRAPLGVYAVLGNHDYSGNHVAIASAVERAGIQVIDNKSVLLDDAVWLVGRSDETDLGRPIAKDLLTQVDTKKPVIILEHNPSEIEIISTLPIDLHLSGHTHGGQIFPLTELMKMFMPLVYGAKKIAGTQFLVTSGYGFGAVPFRLGTRSEIWVVTLQSTESSTSAEQLAD